MFSLGVDFGGGSSKATLIDEKGNVIKTASTEYPTIFGENGKVEQNPLDWYNAACKNIKEITSDIDVNDIACVCFDAATHTAVLMDENNTPLCNSVYWTDTRSVKEKAFLQENYGDFLFEKCKHKVDTIWSLPEILFIKNNFPQLYSKVKKITFAKDFVRGKFTGDFVTDYIEAQGSMLFDFDKHVWEDELLSLIDMTKDNMPKIVNPLDLVGYVNEQASLDSGLAVGTKVICGATDTVMEVFATGGVNKGDMTLKLATAGRICVVTDKYVADKNVVNYSHLKDGLYYPGSATKSCASSLRWFRDTFGGDFSEFSQMAKDIPVGSDGLIFHPYLVGELTPFGNPKLRGGFTMLGAEHTKAHFVRAVMEGVAFSLLDGINYLKEKGITASNKAYVIGGGAKSEVWKQIVADALGITLIETKQNDSSFGSAMCAGVAVGFFTDLENAVKTCNEIVGVVEPNPENSEKYAKIYKKYKKISNFYLELIDEQ